MAVPSILSRHRPQSGLIAACLQFVGTDPESSNSLFVLSPATLCGIDYSAWLVRLDEVLQCR
jgi:hypothetical protein